MLTCNYSLEYLQACILKQGTTQPEPVESLTQEYPPRFTVRASALLNYASFSIKSSSWEINIDTNPGSNLKRTYGVPSVHIHPIYSFKNAESILRSSLQMQNWAIWLQDPSSFIPAASNILHFSPSWKVGNKFSVTREKKNLPLSFFFTFFI